MRIFALVIAALFLVTACQTTENIGTGPILYMPDKTVRGYRQYLLTMDDYPNHNFAFAYDSLTQDWSWSGKSEQSGQGFAVEQAIERCVNGRPDSDCKVLDINGRIVWKEIGDNVYARLTQEPPKIYDAQTHDYDPQAYRISATQLERFKLMRNGRERSDNSAFFISSDGTNYGGGSSTGGGTGAYSATIRNARKHCQIASPDSKCYLFTTNGEPINEAARRALEESN